MTEGLPQVAEENCEPIVRVIVHAKPPQCRAPEIAVADLVLFRVVEVLLEHLASEHHRRQEVRGVGVLAEVVGERLRITGMRHLLAVIVEADDKFDVGLRLVLIRPNPTLLDRHRLDEAFAENSREGTLRDLSVTNVE